MLTRPEVETGVLNAYGTILIQRENPALPAKDECSDALLESRTEQGGSESRKLRATISVTVPD